MRRLIRVLAGALALVAAVGCGPTVEDLLPCAGVTCSAGTCQVEDGAPVCVCSAEDTAAGRTCERVEQPSGRAEDNDYPEHARELRPGDRVQATLNDSPTAWRDLYLVRAAPTQLLRLRVSLGSLKGFDVTLAPAAGGPGLESSSSSDPRVRAWSLNGASGDLLLEVRPSPQDAQGTYTVQLDALVDDHGDTRDSARVLTPSTTTSTPGKIDYPEDVDLFRFDAARTGWHALWCTQSSGSVQALLLDAAGNALQSVYCGSWGARTDRTLTPGTYYLRVSGLQGSTYSLRVVADDHGDRFEDATPVALGASTPGSFFGWSDADFFSFPVRAGHTYRVRASDGDSSWHNLDVWSGPTAKVASGSAPGLTFTALTDGTYALQVSGGYEPRTYVVLVEDEGADDHGDSRETATHLEEGTDVAGRFPVAGDVDFFSFDVRAQHGYRVTITQASASYWARVWDEQGVLRVEGSAGPFELLATADGVAYLQLVGNTAGTYSVRVDDVGADDHGDTWASATVVALGTSTRGVFFGSADRDFFSFAAEAGHTYRVRAWDGTSGGHRLRVWSAPSTALREGPAPELLFAAGTTGTHAVEVYAGAAGTDYLLSVEDLGTDDHGDSSAAATPVALDTPVDGWLGVSGDRDFFRFEALAGHGYLVRAADGSSTSHRLQLWDGAGTLVATGWMPELVAEAAADGPLYAEVSSGQEAVSYVLRVRDLGTEQGDTLATATPVALGEEVRGYFAPGRADVDVVRFEAQAGHVYRVRAADGTSSGHALRIFDAAGTRRVDGADPETRVKALADGPLYAEVSAGGWAPAGATWVLGVTEVGVDDLGDTEQDATPLVLVDGAADGAGTTDAPNDVDVFSFATEPGRIYYADTWGGGALPRVSRADGAAVDVVETSLDGYAGHAFKATAGGTTHFLHVRLDWEGPFWLRVRDLGPDDHGDSAADATVLTLGRSASGTSQYRNERDVFVIERLVKDTRYQVSLVASDAQLEIRAPDGQLVWRSWDGSFVAPQPGTYRFDVVGGWSPGAFTLKVD